MVAVGWQYRAVDLTGRSDAMPLIRGYEDALRARGRAPKTIAVYLQTVRLYCASCDPVSVTSVDVERWLAGFEVGANTRGQYLIRVRGFHRWLQRAGYRVDDPTVDLERPRVPPVGPRPLPDTVLEAIWEAADPMERAWIVLGLYCGLRAGEAVRVQVEDLCVPGQLRVVGKGNRERWVPVRPEVLDALRTVGWPRAGRFFSRAGEKAASTRIGRLLRAVGAPGWASYHCLRHTYGTRLYAATHDIRLVQELLGHSSVATTERYVQVDRSRAVGAVLGLPPLGTPPNAHSRRLVAV